MVNTEYLEAIIKKSGKRKGYLAERCGMTIQTFKKKCSNSSDFFLGEACILSDELNLTSNERSLIFFASGVDKMPTNVKEG